MTAMRAQAVRFGAELVTAKVTRLDLSKSPFGVWIGDPEAARAHLPGRGADRGHRRPFAHAGRARRGPPARATASRPAPPATGSSSAASRSRWSAGATRRSKRPCSSPASPPRCRWCTGATRCGPRRIMQDRALANPNIEFRWNTQVTEVLGDGKVGGRPPPATPSPAAESELAVTGLFVAIGHEPNTAVLAGQLELDENGLRADLRRVADQRRRGLRLRRRPGPRLPPGGHRRRLGLHGGHRRRALARGPGIVRPRAARPAPGGRRARGNRAAGRWCC